MYHPKATELQLSEDSSVTLPLISISDERGLYLDELEVDSSVQAIGSDSIDVIKDVNNTLYPIKLLTTVSIR